MRALLISHGAVVAALCLGPAASAGDPPTLPPLHVGGPTGRVEPSSYNLKPIDPVARVNGEPITREQLAEELIATYGAKHLNNMIERKLVQQSCQAARVEITQQDVSKALDNALKNLNMSKKEFVERVLAPNHMTFVQHVRDNIWPQLAMIKLVGDKVKVTDEELTKGFEANYGAKVDCRMLVVAEARKAQECWTKVNDEKTAEAKQKLFEDYCKRYSVDEASRAYGGQIEPINRHSSNEELEKMCFGLKEGEQSKIVQVPGGTAIFYCVRHLPPVPGVTPDTPVSPKSKLTVKDSLREAIKGKKIVYEAQQFFEKVRREGKIENFLTGDFDAEAVRQAGTGRGPERR